MQHEPPREAETEAPVPSEEMGTEEALGDGQDGGSDPREVEIVDAAPEDGGEGDEATKWKEAAMRAVADLDNYRKRMAREKAEAVRYANQGLLLELLPVLDNFEMGLQAAAADRESMIFRGMEMVKKQLDEFLGSQGVEDVPAEGQVFDPNLHDAVSQEESSEVEDGVVLRVIRRGYKMNDRLLRPANVVVAKAPGDGEEPDGH